jgi:hypothetical protein
MRAATIVLAGLALACVGTPAAGQAAPAESAAPALEAMRIGADLSGQAEAQAGAPWEVTLTPYLWFAGLDGQVGVFPRLPPVDVDLSFGDVFSNLDVAVTLAGTVRKDRFVALADFSYLKVSTSRDVGIRDPSFLNVSLDTRTITSTVAAGYRAMDQGEAFVDVVAGGRLSSVDTELALNGPARSLVAEDEQTWVDPIVGARTRVPLGQRWVLALYGDVGGFGVSSDLTWQLVGSVQYAAGRNWHLAAGWRHYAVDYQDGAFIYDVTMTGPIVGASFRF